MSKMTDCQQVKLFSRQHGINVNGKGGIPVLSKGEWAEFFDNWQEAKAFLVKARLDYIDNGIKAPWH